jgi:hypothetical protein
MKQPIALRSPASEMLLAQKWLLLFGILITCEWILRYLYEYSLIDNSLYYDYFGDKLSYERINHILEQMKNWKWLNYAIVPLFTLLKCFLISASLYTGAILDRSEHRFADFFKTSLLAEFIWLFPSLVNIIWFGFIHRDYKLNDLMNFSPSLLAAFDRNELESWLIYPLKLISLYEVCYFVGLAYLLKPLLNRSLWQSLGFVSYTYGVALLIWALMITFIKLSNS